MPYGKAVSHRDPCRYRVELNQPREASMGRYVIERSLPGAGRLTAEELTEISARSNSVLAELDDVSWVQSYVSDDKLYCIYDAADPALIEEHAQRGGFPVDTISPVRTTISPRTGR